MLDKCKSIDVVHGLDIFSIDVVHHVLVVYDEQTAAIVQGSHVEQGLIFEQGINIGRSVD